MNLNLRYLLRFATPDTLGGLILFWDTQGAVINFWDTYNTSDCLEALMGICHFLEILSVLWYISGHPRCFDAFWRHLRRFGISVRNLRCFATNFRYLLHFATFLVHPRWFDTFSRHLPCFETFLGHLMHLATFSRHPGHYPKEKLYFFIADTFYLINWQKR